MICFFFFCYFEELCYDIIDKYRYDDSIHSIYF